MLTSDQKKILISPWKSFCMVHPSHFGTITSLNGILFPVLKKWLRLNQHWFLVKEYGRRMQKVQFQTIYFFLSTLLWILSETKPQFSEVPRQCGNPDRFTPMISRDSMAHGWLSVQSDGWTTARLHTSHHAPRARACAKLSKGGACGSHWCMDIEVPIERQLTKHSHRLQMAASSECDLTITAASKGTYSTPDHRARARTFKSLVSDLAERLESKDVKKICWQLDLPPSLQEKTALEALMWLVKHGKCSEINIQPLVQLLKDIHREELAGRVETFQNEFGKNYFTKCLYSLAI